ncbi:MAG TPA: ABC transporter permease subunit [Desulfobacterales bacterium]|nr:ABC transporter permease subunit [Desulfobacterales bacterium]HIP39288.1 ABC transporter permease subunit [Desulfocapsa sulfexigens]
MPAGIKKPGIHPDKLLLGIIGLCVIVPLILFLVFPIVIVFLKSFQVGDGNWGLANYTTTMVEKHFWVVVWNSLWLTVNVTVVSVLLGFVFAYAIQRSQMPGKRIFTIVAMLPMFAPSLLQALGLVFLLGRNGIINRWLGLDIEIYGFWGVFIADVIYAFPQAFMILSAAFAVADSRPYEAARMLGANKRQIFFDVTLPGIKFGLISSIFLVFTITITDFGNPMVIGGNFSVLATEIYNQVSGQMNFNLGSVISIILLIPVVIAFAIERFAGRKQEAFIPDNVNPLVPKKNAMLDTCMFTYSSILCGIIVLVVAIVVYASFVKLWPYNMSFTLNNYKFDSQGGYDPLITSVIVSLMAAFIGVVLVFGSAYVVNKSKNVIVDLLNFFSILPAAIPGMVLGLAYIFFFNDPSNPLNILYGTVFILTINSVYHYFAQGFLTASTSLQQISSNFDETSACLGANLFTTIKRVTLPILLPSILSVAVFFFMRTMVTLAAVIFLVSPSVNLAAVSVMLLDDAGNTTQAAAYSTLIILVVLIALLFLNLVLKLFKVKTKSLIS